MFLTHNHPKQGQLNCNLKATNSDVEKQDNFDLPCCGSSLSRLSPFSSLVFLDRILVVLISLAMRIGILLGNLVDVRPALQKGTFVDVSLPIGAPSNPKRRTAMAIT